MVFDYTFMRLKYKEKKMQLNFYLYVNLKKKKCQKHVKLHEGFYYANHSFWYHPKGDPELCYF
jgi:hypothetical protein